MLQIQKYIKEFGFEKAISDFKLKTKFKNDLVLLKYDQIESPMSKIEVQECRGLILNSTTYDIVCLPFTKFFNYGEGNAAVINWKNAKIFTKLDGSIISMYYYNDTWNVSTSGVPDADTNINAFEKTFKELFWYTINLQYGMDNFLSKLDKNNYYMFELCTPENIVVTQHFDYKVYLLGVRDSTTLKELYVEDFSNIFLIPEIFDFNNINDLLTTFDNMPWQEEGYVVRDNDFNRIKVKNPLYVSVHRHKTGSSPYEIINIIKSNEIEEFCIYVKEKTTFLLELNTNWNKLEYNLNKLWNNELNIDNFKTQKDFALAVFNKIETPFTGIFFALKNNKIKTIREGLCNIDNKFLYNYLQDINFVNK